MDATQPKAPPANGFPAPKKKTQNESSPSPSASSPSSNASARPSRKAFSPPSWPRFATSRRTTRHANVRVALTRYREAVRNALGDEHPALKYLHSFRQDIADYNEADRRNVYDHHRALQPIDPDLFIERALGQLESPNYGRMVAALLLLTGRRTVEVCFSGEFALVPDATTWDQGA